VSKGDRIGYNGTYTAPRAMIIATVPLGYNEGIDRRLSNKGWVEVRGMLCPVIGRVSMNITTIDVSALLHPTEGEQVTVIAPHLDAKHGIVCIAQTCATITYDICVHLQVSIPRCLKK
jgi:alanine racemase